MILVVVHEEGMEAEIRMKYDENHLGEFTYMFLRYTNEQRERGIFLGNNNSSS
jgi:hypothetical protein